MAPMFQYKVGLYFLIFFIEYLLSKIEFSHLEFRRQQKSSAAEIGE